jgi:hypothetical protein
MSQLKTNNITHLSNTGGPNIVLGDSGDVQVQSLNSGPLSGFRNQIINGDFRVWQRGGGPHQAQVEMNYGPDRWRNFSNANNQLTRVNSTFSLFERACRVNNTSGAYVGALGLTQGIETFFNGYPLVNGIQVTVSAYATEPLSLDVFWGPDTVSTSTSLVSDEVMNAGPVIEGSWRRYTYTFAVSTAGRSNADISFNVRFRTSGVSTWDITGIQLEPGPVATPFEHRPIGTELALCQRYFQTCPSQYFPGVSAKQTRWEQKITPAMRADPSVDNIGGAVGTLVSVVTRTGSVQWSYTPDSSNLFSRSFDLDAEL